jgi:hypothetical protein
VEVEGVLAVLEPGESALVDDEDVSPDLPFFPLPLFE